MQIDPSSLICAVIIQVLVLGFLSKKLLNSNKKLKLEKSRLLSQKKSTEVRTGHIVEKFAPFLENFPHDPEQAVFLGQPVDYLVFGEDGVTFSEIKSGNSQLSKKQRLIRDHIKEGRVFWEEIRINDKS